LFQVDVWSHFMRWLVCLEIKVVFCIPICVYF
jgi:hypothetical protein